MRCIESFPDLPRAVARSDGIHGLCETAVDALLAILCLRHIELGKISRGMEGSDLTPGDRLAYFDEQRTRQRVAPGLFIYDEGTQQLARIRRLPLSEPLDEHISRARMLLDDDDSVVRRLKRVCTWPFRTHAVLARTRVFDREVGLLVVGEEALDVHSPKLGVCFKHKPTCLEMLEALDAYRANRTTAGYRAKCAHVHTVSDVVKTVDASGGSVEDVYSAEALKRAVAPKPTRPASCSAPGCSCETAMFFCRGCHGAVYCGKGCQKEHWRNGHRDACLFLLDPSDK